MKRMHAVILATILAVSLPGMGLAQGTAQAAETPEYEWSIDLDCTLCHSFEADTLAAIAEGAEGDNAPELDAVEDDAEPGETSEEKAADAQAAKAGPELDQFAVMHATMLGVSCTDCHTDSDKLAAGHKKLNSGKVAKRLKKSSVSDDACLTCHDRDDLAARTVDSAALVDNAGRTANPHALPENDNHANLTCVGCHEVHKGADADLYATALATCKGCHHMGEFIPCSTCHDD